MAVANPMLALRDGFSMVQREAWTWGQKSWLVVSGLKVPFIEG